MYLFKAQLLHDLKPEDYARRVQFCEDELARTQANPSHLQFLVFTDESLFHLDGHVNKQNYRLWSAMNLNWSTEHAVHSSKVVVWCGIWREGVVGPFFFNSTVTGDTYLKMLEEQILPELETAAMQREVCIFQQDGAPPHYASNVRAWLNNTFPGRWMDRSSPNMAWPPQSPYLTPCDFFVWGI